ncbi:hypothetical protein L810_0706 [Burkholderia sp. AU4i]|nr:hypothetical protein L810_0706 [Burkholderia sp. AU4i]MDW9228563.1 hypothetical protein [Burkholderia cepacia]
MGHEPRSSSDSDQGVRVTHPPRGRRADTSRVKTFAARSRAARGGSAARRNAPNRCRGAC